MFALDALGVDNPKWVPLVVCGILSATVLPLVSMVVNRKTYEETTYTFYPDRLDYFEGFLTVEEKTIPLDRITEVNLSKGPFQSRYGLGTILLATPATASANGRSGLRLRTATKSGRWQFSPRRRLLEYACGGSPVSFYDCHTRELGRGPGHARPKTSMVPMKHAIRLLALAVLSSLAQGVWAQAASVAVWGADADGEVSGAPGTADFIDIAAGGFHALALKTDGTILAWGDDTFGNVSGAPTGSGFTQVDAGLQHSVALGPNGTIVSWGDDAKGQVSGTPTGSGFLQVSAGGDHSVALAANGSIASWGDDSSGEVSSTPTATGFTQVSAGGFHSIALMSNGSIVSWGYDGYQVVSQTPSGNSFVQVAGGWFHSLALKADGSIVGWGADFAGELTGIPTSITFKAVDGGILHSLGLASDGRVLAWGRDSKGQVSNTPTGPYYAKIDDGGAEHCIALSDGRVLASSSFRNAGSNPASYQVTSAPVLGGTFSLTVASWWTGHTSAALVGYSSPNTGLPIAQGVLLVDTTSRHLFSAFMTPPPLTSAVFSFPVPNDPALAGLGMSTQAAHFGGLAPFVLANAQDLVVGY